MTEPEISIQEHALICPHTAASNGLFSTVDAAFPHHKECQFKDCGNPDLGNHPCERMKVPHEAGSCRRV